MPDTRPEPLVVAVDLVIGGDPLRFMSLMTANAKTSLAREPGCRRFDICIDTDDAKRVFLYEVYDDEAAFAAHLASEHFKTFDAETAALITSKAVRRLHLKVG